MIFYETVVVVRDQVPTLLLDQRFVFEYCLMVGTAASVQRKSEISSLNPLLECVARNT